MAFTRPTLAELVDRSQQDFVSRLALAGSVLRRSMVYGLSRVVAGAAHMLHGQLDYLSRQLFADTSERAYLLRQASVYGLAPTEATFATALVGFTGVAGIDIPAGTVLLRSDGAVYTTISDVTLSGGDTSMGVVASEAGAAGSLTPGVVLTFQSPVAGANSTATVLSALVDGVDEESTEGLRTRLLERVRTPPQGGADVDYVAWAKAVPGVTRVWVYPRELGVGTVTVRFMRDGDAEPIPSAGEVEEVQDYLDEVRPVTADVTVAAPVAKPLNLTLAVTPNTTAVKDAVVAELEDLLSREEDTRPGGTLLLSRIRTAIGTAAGLTDYVLTTPAADVTHAVGELPTLGTVTWL